MDVGGVVACVVSAMAGTGFGVVAGGLMGAGRHDDLRRRIADLRDGELARSAEVAQLRAELDRARPRDVHRKPRLAAGR